MHRKRQRRILWFLAVALLVGPLAWYFGPTAATNAADATQFRVRVLNAVPDGAVDVWLTDRKIADAAPFRSLSGYASIAPNNYEVQVYPAGKTNRSDIIVHFFVPFIGGNDYTVIVFGKFADTSIGVSVETDANYLDNSSNARVRFGNETPGLNTVTLATVGTNIVLGRARFSFVDAYMTLPGGAYNLFVNDANGKVITQGSITLGANTVNSIFLLGDSGDGSGPSLIASVDAGSPPAVATATPTATPIATLTSNPTATPNGATATATSQGSVTPLGTASPALIKAYKRVSSTTSTSTRRYFPETGHIVANGFKAYYDAHGGLAVFGYPLTEEFSGVTFCGCSTRTMQYFEKASFEYYPEYKGTPAEVQTAPLGKETLKLLGLG